MIDQVIVSAVFAPPNVFGEGVKRLLFAAAMAAEAQGQSLSANVDEK